MTGLTLDAWATGSDRDARLLALAKARRERGLALCGELGLLENWRRHGRPVLVGAVAHDLALAPDLDLEIYCPELSPEHGFAVLGAAARSPGVVETRYQNHRNGPDKALYWQIRYRDAGGDLWKIDMWSAPDDYALPRGETLVGPLRAALTPETRLAILRLKAWREEIGASWLSIDLYRAVIAGGVRDPETLEGWLARNKTGILSGWTPGAPD